MSEFVINKEIFQENMTRILDAWKKNRGAWDDADALCFCQGQIDDEMLSYSQSSTSQILTLGSDFADTIMIVCENEIIIVTGESKYNKYVKPLVDDISGVFSTPIHVYLKKKSISNTDSFDKILTAVKGSFNGKRLGFFVKEKNRMSGPFIDEYKTYIQSKKEIVECNIQKGFASMVLHKTYSELENIKHACYVSIKAMKNGFFKEMENYYNNEKNVKQSRFSNKIYNMIETTPEKLSLKNIDTSMLETCHDPIIQSGGTYDFSYNTASNDDDLSFDVIMCTLGARYNHYCSNITRTYFINPTSFQAKCYQSLLKVYDMILLDLKPGKTLGEVYDKAKKVLEQTDPYLAPFLYKNLGYGIGVELIESYATIKSGSDVVIERDMCFNLRVGLDGVSEPTKTEPETSETTKKNEKEDGNNLKKFSIMIGETVVVNDTKSDSLTSTCGKEWDQVSFEVGDEDEDDNNEDDNNGDNTLTIAQRVAEARKRTELEEGLDEKTQRELHQRKLYAELVQRKLATIEHKEVDVTEQKPKDVKDIEAYPSLEDYPYDVKRSQIYVDTDKKVVFIPIYRVPVPFHIATIKSVSQNDDKNGCSFRINFHTPQTRTKDITDVMANALEKFPSATYIKTIVVRCTDRSNMERQIIKIKDLQRENKQQNNYAKQTEDLVKQKDLILSTGHRIISLNDVKVRPSLGTRQNSGRLEAHENGFRFISSRNDRLDILFNNIKHAIFQPCYKTLYVIIHFHLKNDIMIGKKRCKDIQFYTEVEEKAKEISEYKSSAYDPDEYEQEQREREKRRRLNDAFYKFTQQIPNLYFDKPYMKMAFTGIYENSHVDITPSRDCLLNITDTPHFVLTLEEIEHVHFERVSPMTHNFDMVVIFKDYTHLPIRFSSIDRNQLDTIKIWLDTINITYSEHPGSINWENIMALAREDQEMWWSDKDEEGESKPPGWMSLTIADEDEVDADDQENTDDDFKIDDDVSLSEAAEDDDDDDDDLVDFDEEDEDDEDEYGEEDEEEGSDVDDDEYYAEQDRLAAEQDKRSRDKELRRSQKDSTVKRRH